MNKLLIHKILCIIVMVGLGSCISHSPKDLPIPEHLQVIEIYSLKDNYHKLVEEAQERVPNAMMDGVVIYFVTKSMKSDKVISAKFDYELNDNEWIFVNMFSGGVVMSEVVTADLIPENPVGESKTIDGIEMDDRLIDSQIAWKIFLSDPRIRQMDYCYFECGQLLLMHTTIKGEKVVYWRLVLEECNGDYFEMYEIDAYSGEVIFEE